MKRIFEEFGDVIITYIPIAAIIVMVIAMLASNGGIYNLVTAFEQSVCG